MKRASYVIESEAWEFEASRYSRFDALASRIQPDDSALRSWFETYAQQHRTRLVGDLAIVERQVAPSSRILDCGAVPLLTTAALAQAGHEVHGVDLAPERFNTSIAELGLDVVRCDLEREALPFDDAFFDAVIFNEIFEHLRLNPITTLREVLRVLTPGGRLMLSTPNLRSLRGVKNLLLHHQAHAASGDVFRQYEKLESLGHMGHVREYTAREVTDFLTQVGFRIRKVIFRGGHGRGLVGLLERLAPSWRPFFTVVATKSAVA